MPDPITLLTPHQTFQRVLPRRVKRAYYLQDLIHRATVDSLNRKAREIMADFANENADNEIGHYYAQLTAVGIQRLAHDITESVLAMPFGAAGLRYDRAHHCFVDNEGGAK